MYQPGGTSTSSGSFGSTATRPGEPGHTASPDNSGHNLQPPGSGAAPSSTTQQSGSKAGEVRGRARETIHQVSGRAREEANAALQRIKEQSRNTLDKGKNKAAQGLSHYAQAVRDFSHRLHEEGNPNVAGYADDIGSQLERLARYLQEHDSRELIGDLGNTVRRHPGLFLAGMFVGGLVAARFLRASRQSGEEESGFDRGEDWTPGQGQYASMGAAAGAAGFQAEGDVSGLPPDEAMSRSGGSAGQAGVSSSAPQPGTAQGAACDLPGMETQGQDKTRPGPEF